MKPYKIIKSKHPNLQKKKVIGSLKKSSIPFRLFKNIHPPRRVKFVFEDVKYEVAPSDGILEHPKDGVKIILDQTGHQQNLSSDDD
jgi:hypothetical protein